MDSRKRGLRTPDVMELQAGWHPKDPGHRSPASSPGARRQMGHCPTLPVCQLALSTWWLAPRPLGWAVGLPTLGMRLAVWSRWTAAPLAVHKAASWLCHAWCLGTSGLVSRAGCCCVSFEGWQLAQRPALALPRWSVKCPRVWAVRDRSQVLPGWTWKRTGLLCSGICLDLHKGRIPGDSLHPCH